MPPPNPRKRDAPAKAPLIDTEFTFPIIPRRKVQSSSAAFESAVAGKFATPLGNFATRDGGDSRADAVRAFRAELRAFDQHLERIVKRSDFHPHSRRRRRAPCRPN